MIKDTMIFQDCKEMPTEEDVYKRLIFGSPTTLILSITDVKEIASNSWKVTFNWRWK